MIKKENQMIQVRNCQCAVQSTAILAKECRFPMDYGDCGGPGASRASAVGRNGEIRIPTCVTEFEAVLIGMGNYREEYI